MVALIVWHRVSSEDAVPKDRRLLLIATTKGMPQIEPAPDIVVGHWHEANNAFVPVETPYTRGPTRPEFNVQWWAEIPKPPEGVELRTLTREDLKG
jgi:hypothetical protein